MADSSPKCNSVMTRVYLIHEELMRGFESETFSGAMVEAMHGEFDVLERDVLERHLLREELANEAVHILVGTALP